MLSNYSLKSVGQSLSEYILVISLIATVSLGGLMLLGNRINMMLFSMLPQEAPEKSMLVISTPAGIKADNLPSAMLDTQETSTTITADCTTADCQNTASVIQLAGANGLETMQAYADRLSQLAEAAANDPNMEAGLKTLITQLANSGHKLADLEGTAQESTSNGAAGVSIEAKKFDDLKKQVDKYLNLHPTALIPSSSQQLAQASGWIATHVDNIDWGDVVLGKSETTTTIQEQSNTVCQNGGNTNKCVK